ncbi:hypothetical protein LTR62_003361 [Meristemomyces frigidus]|uniref:Tr-type G domain-containing protein n=1 Tax=Meristemomyces frigidus TaxID=1508187 RepID=A0AAN7YGY3_9PEZI|nr:hypothetical protein LTR62_003361 [Meristemomyces frigidus]
MASIFTYEPETPRVASPWSQSIANQGLDPNTSIQFHLGDLEKSSTLFTPSNGTTVEQKVIRLQAEPQEGPVEYKLHLLLRPRRKFRSTSTGSHVSGSRHSNFGASTNGRSVSEAAFEPLLSPSPSTPPTALTHQNRQHRLQQLTTQLLWRLQQSSPHHTSSATNIILPSLPEALPELQAPQQPAKLLHGLEESQGALYEIGVADDGSLIGLAEDELNESLNNLRAMAACLGCTVEVLRKETVGECEWVEDTFISRQERRLRRSGKLVVAEALIKPSLQVHSPSLSASDAPLAGGHIDAIGRPDSSVSTEQVRITLTGPTMSGKSSLLGTLTTSTLDNGRGQSRLSMLKHRHEITTGVTSSVTQELLGYQDADDGGVNVINYATENVASWIDVHVAASGSRLVFVSDSAGHPRYRRTIVRGLVGWAPHWTLLCVPADDTRSQIGSVHASQQRPSALVSGMDLSGAQMELCLRLGLPLVVVVTKLDLASRSVLRETLTKVLDALKAAGRTPKIMPSSSGAAIGTNLQDIGSEQIESAYNMAVPLLNDDLAIVPIVLTSAVQGTGIGDLHALLHELPLPQQSANTSQASGITFHIEEIYTKPAEIKGIIVSGRLRNGQLSVGDTAMVGPFSGHEHLEDSEDSDERPARKHPGHLPTSRSFPGALRDSHLAPPFFQLPNQEWRRVEVIGIRNLRLPVHSLYADQVGTIVVAPEVVNGKSTPTDVLARIRKGMVLTSIQPLATRTFVARFKREDLEALAVGNHVVIYCASVRASAKIISARAPDSPNMSHNNDPNDNDNDPHSPFNLDDITEVLAGTPSDRIAGAVTASHLLVTFRFDAAKDFLVLGDQLLVMPGGGPGLYGGQERGEKGMAGLEGFVGRVVETFG